MPSRLITLAIHTYDRALTVRRMLEAEGIEVTLQNVNLERPEVSSGVRVRIQESDLPLALRIVENPDMFSPGLDGSEQIHEGRHIILVPTDFSSHSINAVKVALNLASERKTDLGFVHSYIDPRLSGAASLSDKLTFELGETEDSLNIISTANSKMKAFADSLREKMKNGELPVSRFSTQVMEGVPEDAINEYAKEHIPFLVVMGTRSAEQKGHDMIGSVTAQVLDECRLPVLSIPSTYDGSKPFTPSNILFFSNLDQEDIVAIDALYRFFPSANPNVTIVHIPQRSRFSDRMAGKSAMALSEYLSKTFSHFKFRSVPISPKIAADELRKELVVQNFNLVVVPNRRKNAFSRLFNPGLAYKILHQADIPMLVIPV